MHSHRWWTLGISCALLWCVGAAPTEWQGGQGVPQGELGEAAIRDAIRIRPESSPEQIYREVKRTAEAQLAAYLKNVWQLPWNEDQAFLEFDRFAARIRSMENPVDNVPSFSSTSRSRIFADWRRLTADGLELPHETDAASGPRGGPEDEVVLGSGELILEQTDLRLPERGGVGFTFARYYRSHVDYDGPLGLGWDHNCNQRIIAEGQGPSAETLVWLTGERAIHFERKNGRWEPEPGAFYALTVEGDRIVVETPERTRLTFEPAKEQPTQEPSRWRIAQIASRHNQWRANVQKFQYWPGTDVLRAVEDPYGNRVSFFHDAAGRLTALAFGDLLILYRYDEFGRLKQASMPNVAVRLARVADVAWQYTYQKGKEGRSWLRSTSPPGGFYEKVFEYQTSPEKPAYGRVVKVTLRSREAENRAEDAVWQFSERRSGQTGTVSVIPPTPRPQEEWVFPLIGSRMSCYPLRHAIPSQGAVWEFVHNADGLRVEERAPLGSVTRWEYDSNNEQPRFRGNCLARRDIARPENPVSIVEKGWQRTYHPDIALPTSEESYEIDGQGNRRVLLRTSFEYDPQDLDLVLQRTGEKVRRIVRNRYGLPVASWDARGCTTLYRYYARFNHGPADESQGGLIAETIADAPTNAIDRAIRRINASPITDALPSRMAEGDPCNEVSTYRYDWKGRTVFEQRPGLKVVTLFNKLDQTLAVLDSSRDLTIYDYDAALRRTAEWRRILPLEGAAYSGQSRPDASGRFAVQRMSYDSFGRLSAWNPTLERLGGEHPTVPEIQYEYFPSGQLKKRTTPAGTTIRIDYDPRTGREKSIHLISNESSQEALVLRSEMAYDKEGFLVSYRDARGATHRSEPDGFGRSFATIRPDGVRIEVFSDGLSRPVHQRWVGKDGDILAEERFEYDASGRLVRRLWHRLGPAPDSNSERRIDEWLVAEEYRFDPEGNIVSSREFREGAWYEFRYDGVGRLVWRQSPTGDQWRRWYHDGFLCVESQLLRDTRLGNPKGIYTRHSVILHDERGQPWCTIPVGSDGTVGLGRARLTQYDSEGRLVVQFAPSNTENDQTVPKFTKTTRFFNTLGLLEQEIVESPLDGGRKLLSRTTNQYAPDGLLLRREVYNEPLVFQPLTGRPGIVEATRNPVPQVRRLRYDGFRRLSREISPDGLVEQYSYGPGSLVESLQRYHEIEDDEKEEFQFQYDLLGRLTTIIDARTQEVIQEFEYDWQDQLTRASDYAQQAHPVSIHRSYDNMGRILSEQVELTKDGLAGPYLAYWYDLVGGEHGVRLHGLDDQPTGWRTLKVKQDLAGRVQTIDKDDEAFCRLDYLGEQVVRKRFSSNFIDEEATEIGPFFDLNGYRLVDASNPTDALYEMHYLRDAVGRIIASSVRVPQRGWESSKFYDRDSLGNITAEDTRARFYSPDGLASTRKSVLHGESGSSRGPQDIGAYHVRRYQYDQAGNLIASFRGPAHRRWPKGTELMSAWTPPLDGLALKFPPPVQFVSFAPSEQARRTEEDRITKEQERLLALASNRVACKAILVDQIAQRAQLSSRYKYDRFGRLTQYDSRSTGKTLRWEIEYDALGRVTRMKGFSQRNEQGSPAEAGQPESVLVFAYDPFNRRIVKEVRHEGQTNSPSTVEVMLYAKQRLLVKLKKQAGPAERWTIHSQYVGGPGRSTVLACYERSEEGDRPTMAEYLLHQDLSLNVFLSTRRSQGSIEVFDIAGYWGHGENSTLTVIRNVESSVRPEKGREPSYAIDRVLDHETATWPPSHGAGYLTLTLTGPQRVSALAIWADILPPIFRVYVVPRGEGPHLGESLDKWEKEHHSDQVGGDVSVAAHEIGPTNPLELPLENRLGEQIVLVWDEAGSVQVREFEVFVQPQHVGDLAFSGAVYDAETGLYYHGARYRLPELHAFISPDPLGFLGGDNLYAFARNDPLTWHDPDGRFAHLLVGTSIGAALGAGSYLVQWWWYGEEWSWARLAVHTGSGAAAGLVGAFSFDALSKGAAIGLSATANSVLTPSIVGASAGATAAAIQGGGLTYLATGDISQSIKAAALGAVEGGVIGGLGGGVGGAVLSKIGGSFMGFAASGAAGGGVSGFAVGAYEGYRETGTLAGTLRYGVWRAGQGVGIGAAIGGVAWGVGSAANKIRRLPEQPKGLPDPRNEGLLIRTQPLRGNYGGIFVEPGYARHHTKPLSLGGTDHPGNITKVPIDIHRQPHPGREVIEAPMGTIFY